MGTKKVKVYMCMIDWQHEIGEAAGGNTVYASLNDLKKNHTCWEECGVVEVEVTHVRDIVPQDIVRKFMEDNSELMDDLAKGPNDEKND